MIMGCPTLSSPFRLMASVRLRSLLFLIPWILMSVGWASGDTPWSGTWQTHTQEEGFPITLKQDGAMVSGSYPLLNNGRIEAKVRGASLEGRWIAGDLTGTFTLYLGKDKRTFSGRNENGEWWTGERLSAAYDLPEGNLKSPREAFAFFIRIGNQAQSSNDKAWGAALRAVDFGTRQTVMTRSEKLRQAKELFRLLDLATFRLSSIPDASQDASLAVELGQSGSQAELSLIMRRDGEGNWRILMPGPKEIEASFVSMSGGHSLSGQFSTLKTPRETMEAFLKGVTMGDPEGYALTLSTMDLSEFPEFLRKVDGIHIAECLYMVLKRIGFSELQSLPNDVVSRTPCVLFVLGNNQIVIAPKGNSPDAPWQFTAKTIREIPDLFFATESLPESPYSLAPRKLQSPYFILRELIAKRAPVLLGKLRYVEQWQVLAALLAVSVALVIAWLLASLGCIAMRRLQWEGSSCSRVFLISLMLLVAIALLNPVPGILGIPERMRAYTVPFLGSLVTIAACIVAWHLHRVLGALFAKTTSRTANRVDDILLSFVLTALRIGIIVAGALGIAWFLGIPARGMLAGLGISGLAFALASRDTLANLFGAGILLIDRPFKKGDWIQTDKIEGSVEEVGVRSTRVRTAEDSLVVVPNGKLADSIINNLGTRRQRLVRMQLLITGGGTPENINAFTSAVRSRMAEDKEFSERKLEVSVTSIGKSGIEVELHGYLNVTNSRDETAARHQLLLDVMTLAQKANLILGDGIAKPVPS